MDPSERVEKLFKGTEHDYGAGPVSRFTASDVYLTARTSTTRTFLRLPRNRLVSMEIGFCPTQSGQTYDQFLEQVRYADEHGLDSVFLQEHHETTSMSWPDPLTALTAAATVTRNIRLGTAVLLLPLYHPIRLAERGAMLDGLSDGRFVLGTGLGYRDRDFDVMNVERRERARIFEEYLTIVSRAWSEETFSFDGEYFTFEEFSCSPQPANNSRPDVWMGGYHPKALDRCARFVEDGLADAWLPGTQPNIDGLTDRTERFEGMLAERSVDATELSQPIFRDGIVAPNDEAAAELALEYVYPSYVEMYGGHEGAESSDQGDLGADVVESDSDPMDLVRERAIVGDPDTWIERLGEYEGATGADHVIVRLFFPGMSHEQVMDQLSVLCSEVAPKV